MSRYTHQTKVNGKEVQVVAGWDRMMGYYTYQIQDMESGDMVCTNMTADDPFSKNLDDAIDAFKEHGVVMPEAMVHQLVIDQLNNEGNRIDSF